MVKSLLIKIMITSFIFKTMVTLSICKKIVGDSYIVVTIKKGKQQFLSHEFKGIEPNSMHIMGNLIYPDCNYVYVFPSEINIVRLTWNDNLQYADNMFKDCLGITNIDLSNFETSTITSTKSMFQGCSGLKSLDLSKFNTSLVESMDNMFNGCSSLNSLDLSHFNTSSVISMDSMFFGCSSLTSLNILNFNTSSVTNMINMFNGCSKIVPLNLFNFNTSKVRIMNNMFKDCSNLILLDLSSFDTSNVRDMNNIFNGCSRLQSLNLSNFSTSLVTNMNDMFNGCSSLISLDLSSFNTTLVTNMNYMFYNCSSLKSLDLSYFNTSQANEMQSMFSECSSLRILKISNFNTSKVTNMVYMFHNCSSLESLDLSNFNMSLVTNMNSMFSECFSIKSLNINNYNVSLVKDMSYMFKGCSSLISLNLSSFSTSPNSNIEVIFHGCYSLNSLDISNFDLSDITSISVIFNTYKNLTYLNLKNAAMKYFLFEELMKIFFINPAKEYNSKIISNNNYRVLNSEYSDIIQKTLIYNIEKIIKDQSNYDSFYYYEYNDSCVHQCPDNSYLIQEKITFDINTFQQTDYGKCVRHCSKANSETKICGNENQNIFYCTYNGPNSHFNSKCDNNKYNESNLISNIICYNSPFGYYLDKKDLTLKKCYDSCSICDQKGNETNHNCIECDSNYPKISLVGNYLNCYSECVYFHYFDNKTNKLYCTEESLCPQEYNKLILEKNKCIDDCSNDPDYPYEYKNRCYKELPENSKVSSSEYYQNLTIIKFNINNIETKEFINNCDIISLMQKKCTLDYNNSKVTNKELSNMIINSITSGVLNEELRKMTQKNSTYELSYSLDNALHYISSLSQIMKRMDISSFNFNGCENVLQGKYLFNDIDNLIMYKIEHNVTGFKIPILEYLLFLYENNETIPINLDECNDISIIYYIPVLISEKEINQHNPESEFYNDECFMFTSESGTDISLFDRKNNFNYNNMSLCEKSCNFLRYDINNSRVECECKIKMNLTFWDSETNINDLLTKLKQRKVYQI